MPPRCLAALMAARAAMAVAALRSAERPAHARIDEAETLHLLGPIDVPEIDDHRPRHRTLKGVEIKRSELLPFGHDDQCIGAFRAVVGAVAVDDVGQHLPRLLHAGWIVGPYCCAHVL